MNTLWAVYRNDQHNPFGGRVFLGYAGWHASEASALAAVPARMAAGRITTAPLESISVNRA